MKKTAKTGRGEKNVAIIGLSLILLWSLLGPSIKSGAIPPLSNMLLGAMVLIAIVAATVLLVKKH